jgi:hypothetical protein
MAEEVFVPLEPQKRSTKRWLLAVAGLLIVAGAMIACVAMRPTEKPKPEYNGVVPQVIAEKVSFKVYYPDPAKLPAGYALDKGSFQSPVPSGVAYKVNYGQGQSLVFSVQARPADSELQSFNANYIPLKLDFQTKLGQGAIGAYQGETLATLPILNGPWVIVRGPADVNQDQLKQILGSLKTD